MCVQYDGDGDMMKGDVEKLSRYHGATVRGQREQFFKGAAVRMCHFRERYCGDSCIVAGQAVPTYSAIVRTPTFHVR